LGVVVITNRHVVERGERVTLQGTPALPEPYIQYMSDEDDLAVLGFENPSDSLANMGVALSHDAPTSRVPVTALGYPKVNGSIDFVATQGRILDPKARFNSGAGSADYLQHTANIEPGNSGGPLLNGSGLVLGVNTFKVLKTERLALAIPSERVRAAIQAAHIRNLVPHSKHEGCVEVVNALAKEELVLIASNELRAHLDELPKEKVSGALEAGGPSCDAFHNLALLRLRSVLKAQGGVSASEACLSVSDEPAAHHKDIKFPLRTKGGATLQATIQLSGVGWKLVDLTL
jgi:S1-C subfamily serine protease